ncbi:hypothetical protein DW262_12715 [Segatella copri]|uniref:Uncharacterized protein n=1 Tax=Segatella copri TaxID=165179 RepID=A0A3R6IQH1_9BACT|nr:hypothetical protein DW263_13570 [Segatella copri]RHG32895.1 hypothetical protein DW262_12715 [Segatella copri]RHG63571.1 hypothetical protein DW250_12710 [Segatella copri]
MMMFVRMFHFFHNFAILLVLYNQEHSVPFSISVAKLRKGFCNLVAKVQIALLMLFLFTQKQIDQIQANQQRKKQLSTFCLTA